MTIKTGNAKKIRLIAILSVATCLLLLPLIAMQFSNEVNWKGGDFLIMGVLLYGTGLSCELVMRKVKGRGKRFLVCGIVLIMLFIVWAELAVGVFGTPLAGR